MEKDTDSGGHRASCSHGDTRNPNGAGKTTQPQDSTGCAQQHSAGASDHGLRPSFHR
ncbi:hypothetical protein GCM10009585_04280 [Brevibacterium paucivorans]